MPLYTTLINSKTSFDKYKEEILQYYNDFNDTERGILPDYFVHDNLSSVTELEKLLNEDFFNHKNSEFHVIIHHQTCIGFLTFHKNNKNKVVNLGKLFIREQSRNKGSGKGILKTTFNKLKKEGYKHISLGVATKNRKASSLYKSIGFEEVSKTMLKDL